MGEEMEDDDEDEGHVSHMLVSWLLSLPHNTLQMGMLSDDEAFTTEWELELARKKVNPFLV